MGEILFESPKSAPKSATNFFVCNRWVDKDQNGSISRDEWEGIKSRFRINEGYITFVAYIKQPTGTKISRLLRSPDGTISERDENFQSYKTTIFKPSFQVRDLIEMGGEGLWRMEWFVEGQYVGKSEATIYR